MIMSDKARNKGRMAIYSMAGIYLLFMAYNLVKELPYTSGNQKILSIVFIIFFGIVGGGMVVLSLIQGYKLSKPQQEEPSRELPGAGEQEVPMEEESGKTTEDFPKEIVEDEKNE